MKTYVVDTSALLRLFFPDGPIPADLELVVEKASLSEVRIALPGTALAEVGQVLWKKERGGKLTSSDSDEILFTILSLPLDIVPDQSLVEEAIQTARTTGLTVYDSLFLSLAIRRKADLISADLELMAAWQKLVPTDR